MTAAAIYCRISKDDKGDALGVKRQEKECRALAKSKGWHVADVLTDNDRSAFNGERRAGYDALLEGLRDDRYGAVVAYKLDRLTRSGVRGLSKLLDVLDGRPLACVHDAIDTSTAMGEGIAGIMASMGRQESENIGTRMRSKKTELAEAGKPAGGARAFGYEPDGMTVIEDEAKALRAAAKAVLKGASLTSVARGWNAEGVKPPQSKKGTWTATQIRSVLTNPRHAGLRAHRGEVIGPAAWPAILKPETHERLKAVLASNPRPPERQRSLLTGLVRCGLCGATMHRSKVNGEPVMRCNRVDGCGKVSIKADPVEEHAIKILMTFDTVGFAKVLEGREPDDDSADYAAVAEDRDQLDELARQYAARRFTMREWLSARHEIEQRIDAAEKRIARRDRQGADALRPYAGKAGALRKAWPKLNRDKQRAVLAAAIEAIEVQPTRVSAAKPAKSERHSPGALKVRAWPTPDGRSILERVDFYVLGTTDDEIARLLRDQGDGSD
jgi:site-specific DNA recombinase